MLQVCIILIIVMMVGVIIRLLVGPYPSTLEDRIDLILREPLTPVPSHVAPLGYPDAPRDQFSPQEAEEAFSRAVRRMRELQPDGLLGKQVVQIPQGATDDPVAFPWAQAYQRALDGSMHRRTLREGEVPTDALRIDTLSASRILADTVDLSRRSEPVDCEVTRPGAIVSGHPDEDYTVMSSDGTVTSYAAIKTLDGRTVGHAASSRFEPNHGTIPATIVKE